MTDSELMQLSELVGQALKARGATVTTAESCTGGWVAKTLTDIAGSSAWFERGFVTYSNEAKSQMIGVSEATLLEHGAVSEPVVVEMAIGALRAARATLAEWHDCTRAARQRLLAQPDLLTQLLGFVAEKS